MRIGILVGACGFAVAAATQADITSSTTVPANQIGDRSVESLHRAIGAPGSVQRDAVVRDLKERVERGEISPFNVLLSDALPDWKVAGVGKPGPNAILGGSMTPGSNSRAAAMFASFDDDFSSYPLSDDPIFDRFQVNMQDQINPSGEPWNFAQGWYIPSLFVAGQMDPDKMGVFDPLPRWQGVDATEDANLGQLVSDLNNDGVVDTADLGILLGSFGAMGMNAADLNGDMVVDTADLGILLGEFGDTSGPFCLYSVDVAQTTDPDGLPLSGAAITNGPQATDVIAILNGAYTNDAMPADGCPDCAHFAIEVDGAPGEKIYGDWTLTNASGPGAGADFKAAVNADTCSGYGSEAVLADSRAETSIIENACCFFGARTTFPLFAPTLGNPLIMNVDCFLTTIDTFQWVDTTSSVEGFTVTRTFMGGYAPSLTADFLKYSTGGDGFINHFIFLGNLPGVFTIGQFYGTAPDPILMNQGIEIKTGEWFTLSYRLATNEVSIWLKDSETTALVDAMPGDDGSGTPLDGSDDLEDGFAKIFPTGPFGVAPGVAPGQAPDIPQGPLAAVSMDTFRFLWAGDPTPAEVPGYEPHNMFYDNIHVEGLLFPTPDLPKFALNYLDNCETYFGGANLALQGGRWFDAQSSRAIIDDTFSASGDNAILQENITFDGQFRNEFNSGLPTAVADATNDWTFSVNISMSNSTEVRSIRLDDDVISQDPDTVVVARLLTGVENVNGLTILEAGGASRMHMRVKNPNFDPNTEESPTDVDRQTDLVATPNPKFINVPTTVRFEAADVNVFRSYSFNVDDAFNLTAMKGAAAITAYDSGLGEAQAVGYETAPGSGVLFNGGNFIATSNAITQVNFEAGNQQGTAFVGLSVDDVALNGFGPVIAAGPEYALPMYDDFSDYPVNQSINGQGDTPFVDGASLVDTNLCIEQGLQALNYSTSDLDDWCEYMIKSDAIGGIDPVNDWGLSDGDLVWVRQADCMGAVICKDLQCFTNPNRPSEFFPNAGLFDDPDTGTKAAIGVRLQFVTTRVAFDPPDTMGVCDTFDWDTYDPTNVFCKYSVDSIDDADPDTAGQQDIHVPSLPANNNYYNIIGGKIAVSDVIAVDQIFAVDTMTGVAPCPGVINVSNHFKVVDPCEFEILTGMWTYLGDGMGNDAAQPLDCSDVPHFNFVFDGFPRYQGAGINVVDDPSATGFGNCIKAINLAGFNETGSSFFIDLTSTWPTAYAINGGADCVFETDCYVTDNKSRYAIDLDGVNGTVTSIGLGGPDLDYVLGIGTGSPGSMPVPSDHFSLLEQNPSAGGPFGMGPDNWYYDTGVAINYNAWFRLRVTVHNAGVGMITYTADLDSSGMVGGDGTFETSLATNDGGEVGGPSTRTGRPITATANAINGMDTITGLDQGGTGTFLRDPITVHEDATLPGANTFPDDFCFYRIEDIDGISLGVAPAPCTGILELSTILGALKNVALPNWPDGANPEVCPESQGFIWHEVAMAGTPCTGDWIWLDPEVEGTLVDIPAVPGDVDTWATYLDIPAFTNPGQPSSWYFDNVSLTGSDTP
ncbi:MAG: hypothetical protein H6813_07540 [Phycisphaeraceae bacterium]|nr:hypothetical protein [Phycisphaeraceae bacterium]MCB9848348.1 hypothetical protein [Phycisphaeraceae bacterium]